MAKSEKKTEPVETKSPTPVRKSPTGVTDPAVVIRKITGRGMIGCKKTAEKLSESERSELIAAYNNGNQPRGVLQKALDRLTDEKIAEAKSTKKDSSGE